MWLDRWGATSDEIAAPLRGDELIPDADVVATRSISLGAAPDVVFGWLAQMGFGKAGWYSYDLVDNLGRRSSREIRPEWQVTMVGDRLPGGPISFTVTHIERPHHLVIAITERRGLGHALDFTLAFELAPLPNAATRLVSRVRIGIDGPLGRPAAWLLGIGDGVMVRRQLLGLRQRCGPPA